MESSLSFDCIESHLPALHAIARGICSSPDLAADAVQEALVALWRRASPPPDVRGWLVRTVVHKSLHARRREHRRGRHEDGARSERRELCPLCDPARLAQEHEARAELDAALGALSSELRGAWTLRAEHGWDYERIAAELALPREPGR